MSLPRTWNLFGDDHLPHRLLLLAKMIDRETARQLQRDFGLSLAEWRVLAFVNTVGPSSAADVGAAFDVDRAEVSRAVARLERISLVQRRPDSTNRKRLILEPTDQGCQIFDEARDRRRAFFHHITADLDKAERNLMNGALEKIAIRVDSSRDDPVKGMPDAGKAADRDG